MGNCTPTLENVQTGGEEAQGFKGGGSVEHQKIGWLSFLNAIPVLNAQHLRGIAGYQLQHSVDFFIAAHVAKEKRELSRRQHIALPQREPGVHDRIMTER